MKSGSRFIAITSGPIDKKRSGSTIIVGVVGKDSSIEGILSSRITTDGTDSTSKIISMIAESRFREQIKMIALNGIALAGLNVVDVPMLERKLGVKTVIITRNRPRPPELIKALRRFAKVNRENVDGRIVIVRARAMIRPVLADGLYMQSSMGQHEIRPFAGGLYGAVRLSHLISSGVSKGESTGRI